MAEGFLDIIEINAPESAYEGEIINIAIKLQNIGGYDQFNWFVHDLEGNTYIFQGGTFFSGDIENVNFSFTMPNHDMTFIVTTKHWEEEIVGWVWDVTSAWDVNTWQ